jgi:hypothetical protein
MPHGRSRSANSSIPGQARYPQPRRRIPRYPRPTKPTGPARPLPTPRTALDAQRDLRVISRGLDKSDRQDHP